MTRYVYDDFGRLVAVVDAMNQSTRYTYDLMGNLTSLTDAKNQKTSFEYDGHHRVKKTIYPGGAFETFTYDTRGRLTTMVDRKGITTTYVYDDLGRLTNKSFNIPPGAAAATPPFSYTYDTAGRMLTAQNGSDTLTWAYNLAGELLSEQSVANSSTVAYTYDAGGNRLTLSLDGTLFVSYAYDDASRLTTITRAANGANPALNFGFEYDNANRRTKMTYPNGVDTTYAYDNLNRLTNLAATKTSTSTPITNFGYVYDAAGNRTQKSTLDYTESYKYDDLYRLTGADCARATSGGSGPGGVGVCPARSLSGGGGSEVEATSQHWTYDAVGNRLSAQTDNTVTTSNYNEKNQLLSTAGGGKTLWRGTLSEPGTASFSSTSATINGQPARMLPGNVFEAELNLPPGANTVTIQAQDGSGNIATKAYSVDILGMPVTYTYDANGNLTSRTDVLGTRAYAWNALGQLVTVTHNGAAVATYSYDPYGRRILRSGGAEVVKWAFDREDVLRELRTSVTADVVTRFVHGPGLDEPLLREPSALASIALDHADGLGSIVATTDSVGNRTQSMWYDVWGSTSSDHADVPGFTARETDTRAGFIYSRARWYDTLSGRFLSPDPLRFDGGINFYEYARNQPALLTDPWGLAPTCPGCELILSCDAVPVATWFQHCRVTVRAGNTYTHFDAGSKDGDLSWGTNYIWRAPGPPSPESSVYARWPIICQETACIEEAADKFNRDRRPYNIVFYNSNNAASELLHACLWFPSLPPRAWPVGEPAPWWHK